MLQLLVRHALRRRTHVIGRGVRRDMGPGEKGAFFIADGHGQNSVRARDQRLGEFLGHVIEHACRRPGQVGRLGRVAQPAGRPMFHAAHVLALLLG